MKEANCDSGPNLHSWGAGLGLEGTVIVCTFHTIYRPKIAKIGRGGQCSRKVANKQPVIGGRRAEEGEKINHDLRGERGGAGGMVDSQPGIIRENEGIGS